MLSRSWLAYYDSADPFKRKERGRIFLKDVRLVERVVLREQRDRDEPNRAHAFQIGYREVRSQGNSNSGPSPRPAQEYFLCILAKSDVERDDWITLIRNLIRANAHLAEKFHPSLYSAGRWPCCGDASKSSTSGCEPITWTPRPTKSDPAPPLPVSIVQAAANAMAADSFDDFESLAGLDPGKFYFTQHISVTMKLDDVARSKQKNHP